MGRWRGGGAEVCCGRGADGVVWGYGAGRHGDCLGGSAKPCGVRSPSGWAVMARAIRGLVPGGKNNKEPNRYTAER